MKDADGRRLRERGRSPVPRAAAAQQCAAAHLVTNGGFCYGFQVWINWVKGGPEMQLWPSTSCLQTTGRKSIK